MRAHHKRAVKVLAVCSALIVADAAVFSAAEHIPLWHGMYVILANAETFGGDVSPSTTLGYIANVIVLVLLIPLLGSVISLVTSGLTEVHVRDSAENVKQEIKQHVEDRLGEHHEALRQHIVEVVNGKTRPFTDGEQ